MAPWGRRRRRLGTAHAALPQLQRRLSPFPAAAQRLLPRPGPSHGLAVRLLSALPWAAPARGGGRGARGSPRRSLRTQVRLGTPGTLRGGGSGWGWLRLAPGVAVFQERFVRDGMGWDGVGGSQGDHSPSPTLCRLRLSLSLDTPLGLLGALRDLVGAASPTNPSQVRLSPPGAPSVQGLPGPCSAPGEAQQVLGHLQGLGERLCGGEKGKHPKGKGKGSSSCGEACAPSSSEELILQTASAPQLLRLPGKSC